MPEFIDATFYVDGSIFVNNLITHETTTLNSDDSLKRKLNVLGINEISESELGTFKQAWNEADRARMHGNRVKYALEVTFGLEIKKEKRITLPSEPGTVANVKLEYNDFWEFFTLGSDGLWRNSDVEMSSQELEELIDEVEVVD